MKFCAVTVVARDVNSTDIPTDKMGSNRWDLIRFSIHSIPPLRRVLLGVLGPGSWVLSPESWLDKGYCIRDTRNTTESRIHLDEAQRDAP